MNTNYGENVNEDTKREDGIVIEFERNKEKGIKFPNLVEYPDDWK